MAVILALPRLFDAVKARMDADAAALVPAVDPVPQLFGWREPAKHAAKTLRIVWVPGDDQSGELGDVGPAKQPARNPRPLATLHELFTVYVQAHDPASPEVERAQYQAARELFDAWVRAVHLAAFGTYALGKPRWVIDKKERRHGATIRIVGAIQAAIPDAPLEIAPVDTRAVIDVEELDVTEQMESAPAP